MDTNYTPAIQKMQEDIDVENEIIEGIEREMGEMQEALNGKQVNLNEHVALRENLHSAIEVLNGGTPPPKQKPKRKTAAEKRAEAAAAKKAKEEAETQGIDL